VDDNCFVRQLLTEIFKRENDFDVCGEAANGREAVKSASMLHPDLIVLDLAMPVMNGLDAARVLRQMMPHALLVIYSATPRDVSREQATSIGIAGLVSKTDRVSVLMETVRGVLYRKAA